jgi:chromosome segregation ATPase
MKPIVALLCLSAAGQAQGPAPESATLQSLLAEVRQLRIALERSTSIGPRIQIAVERVKIQQEQATRIARQLEDVCRVIDQRRFEQTRMQQGIERLDSQATQAADPGKRKQFEEQIKELKLANEQSEKSLQQMQSREGELSSQHQAEQAKLAELNDRLDQLERALKLP